MNKTTDQPAIQLQRLNGGNWPRYRAAIETLEGAAYEPARRDSIEHLERVVLHPRGVSVLALADQAIAGFCLGAPLESFPTVSGVRSDPHFGAGDTVYSADTAVAAPFRGRGIARQIKAMQLTIAREEGYAFLAGRNRVGLADAMWKINRAFGAYQVQYLQNDYPDDIKPNACIYYHIRLLGSRRLQ